ncbi:MAG TPA: hypothetical protein VFV87_22055 [Pirellulaceae bacterium]|nr:hypothetical protein [Pirellulaceae bacterium]
MSDDHRSSGSNAGVVIVIALLVVGLMCCGVGAFVGLSVFAYRSVERPPPPVLVQPMPGVEPQAVLDDGMEAAAPEDQPSAPAELPAQEPESK